MLDQDLHCGEVRGAERGAHAQLLLQNGGQEGNSSLIDAFLDTDSFLVGRTQDYTEGLHRI